MTFAHDLFIDGPAGKLSVRVKAPTGARQAVVLVQGLDKVSDFTLTVGSFLITRYT